MFGDWLVFNANISSISAILPCRGGNKLY